MYDRADARLTLDVDAVVGGHHEIAAFRANDLDPGSIKAREHGPGDDLVDGPDHRRARSKIENPVDDIDERIELMRAKQDRDLKIVADASGDFDHGPLMGRIERDQGLVEQMRRGLPSSAWLRKTLWRSPPDISPIER